MHHNKAIEQDTSKPEVIMFYNSTKGGVDSLDQKCALYSTNRRSRRWPLVVWYAVMNISTVNAHVLLKAAKHNLKISRHKFNKRLGSEVIMEHMRARALMSNLPRELHKIIIRLTGIAERDPVPADAGRPKRRMTKSIQLLEYCLQGTFANKNYLLSMFQIVKINIFHYVNIVKYVKMQIYALYI